MKRETVTYECDACKKAIECSPGKLEEQTGGEWRILRVHVSRMNGQTVSEGHGHACSSVCAEKVVASLAMAKRGKSTPDKQTPASIKQWITDQRVAQEKRSNRRTRTKKGAAR